MFILNFVLLKSIISMLSSATEKKRPVDDLTYVKTCKKSPKGIL